MCKQLKKKNVASVASSSAQCPVAEKSANQCRFDLIMPHLHIQTYNLAKPDRFSVRYVFSIGLCGPALNTVGGWIQWKPFLKDCNSGRAKHCALNTDQCNNLVRWNKTETCERTWTDFSLALCQ